jgi:beta-glucanase (GH16 family)
MQKFHYLTVSILIILCLGFIVFGFMALKQSKPENSSRPKPFAVQPAWTADFSQQTDGRPDKDTWNISTIDTPIYNQEQQIYTDRPDNVRVENGALVIDAKKENLAGRNYTSARLDTKDKQSFKYGKIEATVKLPVGQGTWPAVWLLSNSQEYTKQLNPSEKQWAEPRFYMHDGEIDIMEHVGADPRRVESTVHTYARSHQKSTVMSGDPTGFHVFGMEWTPETLTFTVDGKAYHTLKKASNNPDEWPFDQPMYLIVNLAMGGKMGGDIDDNYSNWKMYVKKISYYPYEPVQK